MRITMDPVPLDPGSYTGTYKLVGGRLSLDFVNTVSWPATARRHDWLDRPSNAVLWAEAVGIIPSKTAAALNAAHHADPEGGSRALQRLASLRADVTQVLSPLAHGVPPSSAAVERLNGHLAATCGQRRIDPSTLGWTWAAVDELDHTDGLNRLHGPIVADAADIVTSADHTRLGHCPACDWLFLDTTRNRSRRWCDMNDCGSRAKSLRYYHRRAGH